MRLFGRIVFVVSMGRPKPDAYCKPRIHSHFAICIVERKDEPRQVRKGGEDDTDDVDVRVFSNVNGIGCSDISVLIDVDVKAEVAEV